jgi:hypothetical protein
MAITTYAELQTAMTSWLGHSLFSTQYPDFITLFEAAAARRLKVRPMQTAATLVPSSGSATLPTDYLGHIRATVLSDVRGELTYVHPSYLQALYPSGISDTPRYFTIEGGALKTRSSDATSIELLYYAKNTAIATTLNWLFNNHPDAYLFGSLAEAEAFGVNDERMAMWKARRDEVLSEIAASNFRERGQMEVRPIGPVP